VAAFCIGTLRMAPAAFWQLTPRELGFVIAPHMSHPPDRATLAALMAAYPDLPP
jgi:uncharacterized phage protein (TIGR02216 family)